MHLSHKLQTGFRVFVQPMLCTSKNGYQPKQPISDTPLWPQEAWNKEGPCKGKV